MNNFELGISILEANELMALPDSAVLDLVYRADKIRAKYRGNTVTTCAILNAKSGNCAEDCSFCPQSHKAESDIEKYPLNDSSLMLEKAKEASSKHAHSFGIVTSGTKVSNTEEKETIAKAVKDITQKTTIGACASVGIIDKDFMIQLKEAGMKSLHHNLETAKSFYQNICTTRTYEQNVQTIKDAQEVGLTVCSGGIFGMGESNEQRVELLQTLRELEVDSIPINFYNPVDGTALAADRPKELTPLECLKIIAIARLMCPLTQIRICGGRERNLRDMQSWIFAAGADALMIGSYLTTSGRNVESDMQMIKDAGMRIAESGHCGSAALL